MCAGASASPTFRLESTSLWGGLTHLSAKLHLGNGLVLSEANFSFKSQPVYGLPILLAIFGASLYAIYKLVQSPTSPSRGDIKTAAISSIIVGFIAWLFAPMDVLGIKLDPDILRTYLILGFALSFLGVDKVLGKALGKKEGSTEINQSAWSVIDKAHEMRETPSNAGSADREARQ
jgi:hypothetical protein